MAYAMPYKWSLAVVITAGIGKFTVPLLVPYLTGVLVDRVLPANAGIPIAERMTTLWWLAAAMAGVAVVEGIMIYVRGYYTVRVGSNVAFDVRQSLWRHMQRLSLGFHQSRPSGTLLSGLMSDIAVSQHMINSGIINVCIDAVSGTVALAVLLAISWKLTLIVLSVLPLYGLLYRRINPALRQASHEVQEQTSVMSGSAIERLGGIAVIQTFAQEQQESRAFDEQAGDLRGKTIRRGQLDNILQALNNLLVGLAAAAVWIVGAYFAISEGGMSVGKLIQFTGSAGALYLPIRRFSEINVMFQQSMAAIERIFAIFDVVPAVADRPEALDRPIQRGEIVFRDVHFGYSPSGPEVLKGLDFRVEPGQRIAIVGESGAGKSTLVTLLPRLYDVTGGAISIDGLDIRDYRLQALRRGIGIVLQESILFSGTIYENLRYARKTATWDEIVEAARMANAHAFIMELADGYLSVIGERGTTLSGGQKQRISIARTILQDPRVLIFDEATSALDSESENLITEAMRRVMAGRTSLVIAHRLSTIMGADRILAMRDGRVVEQGSHGELLKAGGYYRYLFEQQFGPLQQLLDESSRED